MRNRFITGLVAAAAAAVIIVPMTGHAGLVTHQYEAKCEGTTGACTATFNSSDLGTADVFVSNIDTHGNFHSTAPIPDGMVNLTWKDSTGKVVYSADCVAPGLAVNVGAAWIGPFDVQSLTCNVTLPDPNLDGKIEYTVGEQTLIVTPSGAAAGTTPFGGEIAFSTTLI